MESLIAFLPVVTVLVLVPGANNLVVIRETIAAGPRGGRLATAGTSLGILVWAVAVAAGLGVLLQANPRVWVGLPHTHLTERGSPRDTASGADSCRRAGRRAIADWEFCLAFAMFRLAAIAQGIMGRVVAGTANDPNAQERGRRARPLADSAWALISSRI